MKHFRNRFLSFALSLLVILTGQGVAASRGVDTAVGQMVLCTGVGPVVIYMDAEGQPAKPPHFCPDYALTLLGAIAVVSHVLPDAPSYAGPYLERGDRSLIAAPVPFQPARAPPARA